MTDTAQALQSFFGGFGLMAYPEQSVPVRAELPYITYMVVRPDGLNASTMQVRVWYRSQSFVEVNAKADEITCAIASGIKLPASNGMVVLRPSAPLMQYQPMGESNLKVVYINLQINVYGMNKGAIT